MLYPPKHPGKPYYSPPNRREDKPLSYKQVTSRLTANRKVHLPPTTDYCGLTVVLSNPSRLDTNEILSGTGGSFFRNECLFPHVRSSSVDIRLCSSSEPLLPNTKGILLLGQRALSTWSSASTTLGEQRGSPLVCTKHPGDIPCIASYLPQDAVDPTNHEKRLNPLAIDYDGKEEDLEDDIEPEVWDNDEDEEGGADTGIESSKGHGKTRRSNFRFWLKTDTRRILEIINFGGIPRSKFTPCYSIFPPSDEIINVLSTTKNHDLYIDIETDFISLDMRCFAFSFIPRNPPDQLSQPYTAKVYVVPTLDVQYKPAYGSLPQILLSLAIAFRDNTVIAHNGSLFDFLVFAYKYSIPVGRNVWDTMIAQHRIYPEVERSLGHCMSLWTYEPYHKNEGMHGYYTEGQAYQLYEYCGKDVFGMVLVRTAQMDYASKDPGLQASIDIAMKMIRPYLTMTMLGIRFNEEKRAKWMKENDRLMTQYLRMMQILTGPAVPPLISPQKCNLYFADMLGYPAISVSDVTGKASFEDKNLIKLRLKHNNPVIDILLQYRKRKKESGTLKFIPWKQSEPSQSQGILHGLT